MMDYKVVFVFIRLLLVVSILSNLIVYDDDFIRPRVRGRPRCVESWERMG